MNKFIYYVKEQKSVTAVLEDLGADLSEDLSKSFRRVNIDPASGFHFFGQVIGKFFRNRPLKIRAKAKCSPNDTWDEELGTDIARARLVIKVNDTKFSLYDEMLGQLYQLCEELEEKRDLAAIKSNQAFNALFDLKTKSATPEEG